ncbi:MAG: hypothetical protein FWE34_07045 [Defluviitaleaceae bacterium]|nr:hypothetical protein [Defluviitaleaceae bacterium]
MNEEQLLDKTLEILSESSADKAYAHLLSNKDSLEEYSSQLYNFLYCLGAVVGAKDEALAWMHEAVIDKDYWYRPEVFEDDDLNSIRDETLFLKCKEMSNKRYYEALKTASTLCTWEEVQSARLALILHGNQQNMYSDKGYWRHLEKYGYQVEYIQSQTIDSHMLYRWEDDAKTQLDSVIKQLPWDVYDSHILCGFSAGCNEILKTLLNTDIKCEKIILQSPWIPVIDNNLDELIKVLSKTEIEIICGENDDDCLPYAKRLAEEADRRGINCKLQIIPKLGHSYPI